MIDRIWQMLITATVTVLSIGFVLQMSHNDTTARIEALEESVAYLLTVNAETQIKK